MRRAAVVLPFLFSLAFGQLASTAQDSPILVKVKLNPLGSFEITTNKVIGKGKKNGTSFTAKELKVPVATLKTGMALRDKHLKEKLEFKKHRFITVKNIKAANGKGTGTINVMGIPKPVQFSYQEIGGNKARANFKLSLKDFKISGINYQGVGVEDTVEIIATLPYEVK